MAEPKPLARYASINLPANSEALNSTTNTGQERNNFFIALEGIRAGVNRMR
jgi:hypothetical protein